MFINCHSFHSLRYGTLSIKQLVEQAAALGIRELVLTDINTITGIYDFKKECEEKGIKPIPGVEVRKEGKLLYVAIARKFSGIGEINTIITEYNCNGKELCETAPEFKDVSIVYPMSNIPLSELKDNEFIGVRIDELNFLIRPE
jgi:DNA polymerase III alpha subunit